MMLSSSASPDARGGQLAQPAPIRVAVVGGLSRGRDLWSRAGAALGVEIEHHDGQIRGRRAHEIVAAVRRADVVVIITEPNSHGGVAIARRAAVLGACPHMLVKRLRPAALGAILADLVASVHAPGGRP